MKGGDQIDSRIIAANKDYYQIDKHEVFRGIQLCRENAINLFEAAERVKRASGRNGTANSLMILSAEECVKCYVFCAVYINYQLPFELMPIFRDHIKKHTRGKEIQNLVNLLAPALGLAASKHGRSTLKAASKLALNILFPPKFEEWWDKANRAKNLGLYVDYSFENRSFLSPNEVSETEFAQSREVVSGFIETIKLTEFLKPDDYKILIR